MPLQIRNAVGSENASAIRPPANAPSAHTSDADPRTSPMLRPLFGDAANASPSIVSPTVITAAPLSPSHRRADHAMPTLFAWLSHTYPSAAAASPPT